MKRAVTFLVALSGLAAAIGYFLLGREAESQETGRTTAAAYGPERLAANGIVEGARPELSLRPEVPATIVAVYVRENQEVPRGAILVELYCEPQKQQVALAEAELAIAQADLQRLRNGERPERLKALAAAEGAREAVYLQAKKEWERCQHLVGSRAASAEQCDADYFRMLRARAELEEAMASRRAAEAPARAEDLAAAVARVSAAEARLRLAQAELAKTRIVAPFAGRVLQVGAEPGELAGPASARPVLMLADLSRYRVRAFVEELDAARAQPGQRATVTTDGLPGKEFSGRVALVLSRMGTRAPLSDRPGEYRDVYYREVLIDLDSWAGLTLNLRVQVLLHTRPVPAAAD